MKIIITHDTILRANKKTKNSSLSKRDCTVGVVGDLNAITVSITHRGKSYSTNLSLEQIRTSYGKAVKTSKSHGKGI